MTVPIIPRSMTTRALGRSFLTFAAMLAALMLTAQYFNTQERYKESLRHLRAHAKDIGEITAQALELPLWNLDSFQARTYLQSLEKTDGFCGARVIDESGKIFAESGRYPDTPNSDQFIFVHDINFNASDAAQNTPESTTVKKHLGRIHLCASATQNASQTNADVRREQLYWLMVFFGSIAAHALALGYSTSRNQNQHATIPQWLRTLGTGPVQAAQIIFAPLTRFISNSSSLLRISWLQVYFILAAFNIFSVGYSVYMNHALIHSYSQTTLMNAQGSEIQKDILKLINLSLEMNAPGNDVFLTRDPTTEKAKFDTLYKEFSKQLERTHAKLNDWLSTSPQDKNLLTSLDDLSVTKGALLATVNALFLYYQEGQQDKASASMAEMDQQNSKNTRVLSDIAGEISVIQNRLAEQHAARIESQRIKEIIMFSLVVLMAALAVVYGQALARRMRQEQAVLADYRENLEQKVSEQTKKISDALAAAEAAGAAKSDFFANMSHELRTPLNIVIGMAQLLEQTQLDDNQREMFTSIRSSSDNLLKTVNDILDVSKIEAGEIRLEYIAFDIMKMIRETKRSFIPITRKKGLSISADLSSESYMVLGDPTRFSRILTNLISNAVRYTDEGVISVKAQTEPFMTNRVNLILEVADTGIGIPKSKLGTIFEKFTQADNSITRRFGGTGLGLTITKDLVELMDGTIIVESEEGKGSIFRVVIPFEISTNPAAHQRIVPVREDLADIGAVPTNRARILIAEDHVMNQIFMRKLMDNLGIVHYTIVANGAEALHEAQSHNYDLILMDCHMPEMNGYDATIAIRNLVDPFLRAVPIVAMTANAMPEDEARCLACGMNGYISKPVEIPLFKRILSQWIRFQDEEQPQPDSSLPSSLDVINLDNLKSNSMEDENFVPMMVKMFAAQGHAQIKALESHCTAGENEEWVEIAHALKGTAGAVGAQFMRQHCAEAQSMRNATIAERREKLAMIESTFASALAALSAAGFDLGDSENMEHP